MKKIRMNTAILSICTAVSGASVVHAHDVYEKKELVAQSLIAIHDSIIDYSDLARRDDFVKGDGVSYMRMAFSEPDADSLLPRGKAADSAAAVKIVFQPFNVGTDKAELMPRFMMSCTTTWDKDKKGFVQDCEFDRDDEEKGGIPKNGKKAFAEVKLKDPKTGVMISKKIDYPFAVNKLHSVLDVRAIAGSPNSFSMEYKVDVSLNDAEIDKIRGIGTFLKVFGVADIKEIKNKFQMYFRENLAAWESVLASGVKK